MRDKKLILFVESLPTDSRNTFFESELEFLKLKFKEVIVIPLYYNEFHIIQKTKNLAVEKLDYFKPINRLKVLFKNLWLVIKIFSYEMLKSKHRLKYCAEFFKNLNVLLVHIGNAENMRLKLSKYFDGSYLLYTYWFKQHTFSLLLLRKMFKSNIKIISRIHGADWDEERIDYFPFRYWQYANINCIVPISEYAKNYTQNNFKIDSNKFFVSKLGIEQTDKLNPIDSGQLNIVSCSGIISLKRVTFIAEVIKKIGIPVNWIHFGNGPEKQAVEEIIKTFSSNQKAFLMGHVSNRDFIKFIKENPVSVFLNWSTSEGIPVSIMEAISYGIPIIAPNVGGVAEIVNLDTGFLMNDKKMSSKELALFIENKHKEKGIYDIDKRSKIKEFSRENFSDKINYSKFTERISNFN